MTSLLGLVGLLGPVRRLAVLTYTATCPACLVVGALSIQIMPTGERPSCRRGCSLVDVRHALNRLGNREGGTA